MHKIIIYMFLFLELILICIFFIPCSSVVTFNYLFLKTLNLFGSLFNDYINAKYKNALSIAGFELSILPWNNGLKVISKYKIHIHLILNVNIYILFFRYN